MAKLCEPERSGSLPDIKQLGTGTNIKPGTLNFSETYDLHPSRFNRVSSFEDNKRLLSQLQDELRHYKAELRVRDEQINNISASGEFQPVNGSVLGKSFRASKVESLLQAGLTAESARGEMAALNIKLENMQKQLQESNLRCSMQENKIKEQSNEIDLFRENDARQTEMIRVLRMRLEEVEAHTNRFESAIGTSEAQSDMLRQENKDLNDKVTDLKDRLQVLLTEREEAEQKSGCFEKKYKELFSQLCELLLVSESSLTPDDSNETFIFAKITSIVQDNALVKGKLASLQETLQNSELESKASRETISRLVAEISREQKSTSRYTNELDAIRSERDTIQNRNQELEADIVLLRERLQSTQRTLNEIQAQVEDRDSRIGALSHEHRERSLHAKDAETRLKSFCEQIAVILGTSRREEDILSRVQGLIDVGEEKKAHRYDLEGRIQHVTKQFQAQYEMKENAEKRIRELALVNEQLRERISALEDDTAKHDIVKDGFRKDKEDYLRFMEELSTILKMDRISHDVGLDMNSDAICARARQLVKLEADALANRSNHIYSLQRKIKNLKEQLDSKNLHLDLLRRKIVQTEESASGKSEIERERDEHILREQKLSKKLDRAKQELADARVEIRELKSRLLSASDLKIHTMEQQKELETLQAELTELEETKTKQSRRIKALKKELQVHDHKSDEQNASASGAIDSLKSELKTTKQALEDCGSRERQLLDLRHVVARMLGLDIDSLAVPDYEIVRRLESLVQSYRSYTSSSAYLDRTLQDVGQAIDASYSDAKRLISPRRFRPRPPSPNRYRSPSPVRVDPKAY